MLAVGGDDANEPLKARTPKYTQFLHVIQAKFAPMPPVHMHSVHLSQLLRWWLSTATSSSSVRSMSASSREILRPPSQPARDQLVLQVENVALAGRRLVMIEIFEVESSALTKATGTPSSPLRSISLPSTPPSASSSARGTGFRVAARDDVDNEYSLFVTRQKAEYLYRVAYPAEAAASEVVSPEAMANGILAHINIIGNRQRDVGKLVCREPEPHVEKKTRVLPATTPPHKQRNPHLPSKRQDQRAVRVQKTSKRTMEAVAQAMRRPDLDLSGDDESAGSEVESAPKVDRKSSEASLLHRMAVADSKTMWKAELETNYEDSERASLMLENDILEDTNVHQNLEYALAAGLSPVKRALPERKTKHKDLEQRRQKGRQQRILVAQAAQETSSSTLLDSIQDSYSTVIEETDQDSEVSRRSSMGAVGSIEKHISQPRASSAPRSSVVVGNAYGLNNLPESDASEPEQFLRRRTLDVHRSVLREDHWQDVIPGMGIEITDERPVYQTPPNRLDALLSTARRVMLVNALGSTLQRSTTSTALPSERERSKIPTLQTPSLYAAALHASHSAPILYSPKVEKPATGGDNPVEDDPVAPQTASKEPLTSDDNNAGELVKPAVGPDVKNSPRPRSKSTSAEMGDHSKDVLIRVTLDTLVPPFSEISADGRLPEVSSPPTPDAQLISVESAALAQNNLRPRSNSVGSEGIVRLAPLPSTSIPKPPVHKFLAPDESESSTSAVEGEVVQEQETGLPPSDPEIVLYPPSDLVEEMDEGENEDDPVADSEEEATFLPIAAGLMPHGVGEDVQASENHHLPMVGNDTTESDGLKEPESSEVYQALPPVHQQDADSPLTARQACWEEQISVISYDVSSETMNESLNDAALVFPNGLASEVEAEADRVVDESSLKEGTSAPIVAEHEDPVTLQDSELEASSEVSQELIGDTGIPQHQRSTENAVQELENPLLQDSTATLVQQDDALETDEDGDTDTKTGLSSGVTEHSKIINDADMSIDTNTAVVFGKSVRDEDVQSGTLSPSLDSGATNIYAADANAKMAESVKSSINIYLNTGAGELSETSEDGTLVDVIGGTLNSNGGEDYEAFQGASTSIRDPQERIVNENDAANAVAEASAFSLEENRDGVIDSAASAPSARSCKANFVLSNEQDSVALSSRKISSSGKESEGANAVYSVEITSGLSQKHDSEGQAHTAEGNIYLQTVVGLPQKAMDDRMGCVIESISSDSTPWMDNAATAPPAQSEQTQVTVSPDQQKPSVILRKKSLSPNRKSPGSTSSTGQAKATSKVSSSRRRSTIAQAADSQEVVPPTPKLERRHTAEDVKRRGLPRGTRRMSIVNQSALPGLTSSTTTKPAAKASVENFNGEASRSNSKRQVSSKRQTSNLPGSTRSMSNYHKKWGKWMVGRNIIEKVGCLQLEDLVIADPNNEENLLKLGMRYTRWSGTSLPGIMLLEHAALLHKSAPGTNDYWFWLGSAHLDIFMRHRKYLPIARFHLSKSIWAFTSAFAYIESLADPMRLLRYAIGLFWYKGDGSLEKTRDIFHELFSRFVSFCDKDLQNLLFLQFQVFHRLKLYVDAIDCMNKILDLHESLPQQAVSKVPGLTSTNAMAHFSVYHVADYRLMLMQCQQASGDYVSAAQSLASVLKLKNVQQDMTLRDEEYFDVWCSLAEKCFHHEDYALALEYYAIALNFAKQSQVLAAIHYNLGLCFQSLGEDNKCVTEYKRARTANRHVPPLVSLAEVSLPYDERFAQLLQKSVAQTIEEVRVDLYGRAVKRLQRVFRQSRRNLNIDVASNGLDSSPTKMPSLSKRRLSIAAARNPPALVKIEDTTDEAEANEEENSQQKSGIAAESQARNHEVSALEVVERRHESFIVKKQAAMEEMAELLANPQYRGREASPSYRPKVRLKAGTQLRSGILSPEKDRVDVRRKHSMEAFRQLGYVSSTMPWIEFWEKLLSLASELFESRQALYGSITRIRGRLPLVNDEVAFCALAESIGNVHEAAEKLHDASYERELTYVCAVVEVSNQLERDFPLETTSQSLKPPHVSLPTISTPGTENMLVHGSHSPVGAVTSRRTVLPPYSPTRATSAASSSKPQKHIRMNQMLDMHFQEHVQRQEAAIAITEATGGFVQPQQRTEKLKVLQDFRQTNGVLLRSQQAFGSEKATT